MHLSPELNKRLKDEMRLAVDKMVETENPNQMLYYFSVFFGEATRVLNWQWDEDLVLIWTIGQNVHGALNQRLQAITQGERVITITKPYFDALKRQAITLVEWVEKEGNKTELCDIMAGLAKIIYATTGNGFYLLDKGFISLEN